MRSFLPVVCLIFSGAVLTASPPTLSRVQEPAALQGQALVYAALANELRAAQDLSHPMRYLLRKSSPRFTTTRQIYETKDGDVARLVSSGEKPLNADDAKNEQARLAELTTDPARQRHRKQAEDADRERALKALRALPRAFLYQEVGSAQGPAGKVEKFTFRPNPSFSPADLETQALTAMTGEIWIDPAEQRVVRLEGHLLQDVDFGWGILGRLNKGGWIRIDQADIGGGQWRTVHLQMVLSGRVVFKNRVFDTTEEESQFGPLPASITYREAISMMQADPPSAR